MVTPKIRIDVANAERIDKDNGNALWKDALNEEMGVVRVAFKIQEDGTSVPVRHQEIKCHLAWDVKLEDFT